MLLLCGLSSHTYEMRSLDCLVSEVSFNLKLLVRVGERVRNGGSFEGMSVDLGAESDPVRIPFHGMAHWARTGQCHRRIVARQEGLGEHTELVK